MSSGTPLPAPTGTKIVMDSKTIPGYADDGSNDTSKAQGMMIFSATKGDATGLPITAQGMPTYQAGALTKDIDSITTYPRGTNWQLFTASGQIMTVAGKLLGLYVCSSSSGTVKIWDSLTATGTNIPLDTTSVVAKDSIQFHAARMGTAAYLTITGTATVVAFYDPTSTN